MKVRLTFIAALLLFAICSYGQSLESNGFSISLKSYDLTETDFPLLGKQKIIVGLVTVTKNQQSTDYKYYVPLRNDSIVDVALHDLTGKELFPKMWYHTRNNEFSFENKKAKAMKNSDYKEIIMSGILLWAVEKLK